MRQDELNEFKKTTGEINEAMISISAILNKHKKGKLFFGLKNDGTPFKFEITDSTIRDVSRKIFESIKPQIIPTIKIENMEGTDVIVVEFSGNDIPYSAFGKYYIRTADEDRELSPSELRKIMIGQEYVENWENITSNETLHDVDDKTLKSFYNSAINCNRMPKIEYNKKQLLEQLGVVSRDNLTNAGVMLFSKKTPITLKMAVFATEHKTTFLDIAREEGNIFHLIDSAVSYIVKNIRWRVEIDDDGIHRKEIPEVPIDAIREAVINSFAHARYDIPIQHEIDIFSNRIVITNPGSFANDHEPIDFVNKDIRSYLRNEAIAHALYLCKDVESFGSGIKKIYSLCNEAKVNVSYENEESSFSISFSRMDRNVLPNDNEQNGEISDVELSIYNAIKENPYITNEELAESTGKSLRTISRAIFQLKGKKLIERVGSNKMGYWKAK